MGDGVVHVSNLSELRVRYRSGRANSESIKLPGGFLRVCEIMDLIDGFIKFLDHVKMLITGYRDLGTRALF